MFSAKPQKENRNVVKTPRLSAGRPPAVTRWIGMPAPQSILQKAAVQPHGIADTYPNFARYSVA